MIKLDITGVVERTVVEEVEFWCFQDGDEIGLDWIVSLAWVQSGSGSGVWAIMGGWSVLLWTSRANER
jgi:hypothetical protein